MLRLLVFVLYFLKYVPQGSLLRNLKFLKKTSLKSASVNLFYFNTTFSFNCFPATLRSIVAFAPFDV